MSVDVHRLCVCVCVRILPCLVYCAAGVDDESHRSALIVWWGVESLPLFCRSAILFPVVVQMCFTAVAFFSLSRSMILPWALQLGSWVACRVPFCVSFIPNFPSLGKKEYLFLLRTGNLFQDMMA